MSLIELISVAVLALGVACAMEPWSAFVHGRFWHGPLYGIHRTHHPEAPLDGRWLEVNDVFSVVHAVPAMGALALGFSVGAGPLAVLALGLGIGLSLYGTVYALVHDGLVHGRFPVRFLMRWRFFRRIRAAHEVHHRAGGPPYGLFLGPQELRRARSKSAEASGGQP